VGLWRSWERA